MKLLLPCLCLAAAVGLAFTFGCQHEIAGPLPDVEEIDYSKIERIVYSQHVQPIFNQKCMSASCHNSADRAAGLQLDSWEKVMAGSRFSEVVISGNSQHSHMIEHLRGLASPRMPLGRDTLSSRTVDFLARWIDAGARNDAGVRPFEGITEKAYVTNQGNDLVAVISTQHNLVARLLPVGDSPRLDVPHNLFVDAQSKYWYVTLIDKGEVWKFEVATDTLAGKVRAGRSPANVVVSPDGSRAYVSNWEILSNGRRVQVIDTNTMTVLRELRVGFAPHGLALSRDGLLLYVTNYLSDSISIIRTDTYEELGPVLLAPDVNPVQSSLYQPLQIALTPDDRLAYVTCFAADQVRVIDTAGRNVTATIAVGKRPFLLEVTPDGKQVYVCNQGSNDVTVIRVADNQVATTITAPGFANPHGVAFTRDGRFAYVTNENLEGDYPAHHPPSAGGRPGNVQVIDMRTLQAIKTIEVEADPTGIAVLPR